MTDAFSRQARRLFPVQVLWGLGRQLDSYLVEQKENPVAGSAMQLVGGKMPEARVCALYHQARGAVVARSDPRFFSGTVDKSRVKTFGLFNGFFCMHGNIGLWAVPQDCLGQLCVGDSSRGVHPPGETLVWVGT